MAEKEVSMPAKIPKFFSLILLATGLIIYFGWVAMDPSTYSDIGLVSVVLMFAAAGLGGFWHYSNMEREEKLED